MYMKRNRENMNADQIKKDIMMKKSPEMEIKNFKEKEELLQEEF